MAKQSKGFLDMLFSSPKPANQARKNAHPAKVQSTGSYKGVKKDRHETTVPKGPRPPHGHGQEQSYLQKKYRSK